MILLHVVLGFVIEAIGTNNFISLYMNRTGFPCIESLFMTKIINILVICSDCKYVVTWIKSKGKKGIKKLCLEIGLWIIVYVLGS